MIILQDATSLELVETHLCLGLASENPSEMLLNILGYIKNFIINFV
jgi:hypothetical protein